VSILSLWPLMSEERGAATAHLEEQTADLDAKITVQVHTIADLDRRVSQIDSAIEVAARRGKTDTALSAMEGQQKARAGLVDERKREAVTLAALQAERASGAARGVRSRPRPRRSSMWPSFFSAPIPTASERFGG
jgi:hypothetical protein